jgi:hypothetical protein
MRITSIFVLSALSVLSVASTSAQQGRSLKGVKKIRLVALPQDSVAMNNALTRQVQQTGVFEVVQNPTDPADAVLAPLYGCSTETGEFLPQKQRQTMRGLCGVALIDPDAEDANGRPLPIWSIRFWRIPELYLDVEKLRQSGQAVDVQDYVARGVVADLLTDRQNAIAGKPDAQIQTLTLGQVKTIFVSVGDYSYETAADKIVEDLMRRQLAKWTEVKGSGKKKWKLSPGDDWIGVESILPGVRIVFYPALADAILIGPYTQVHAGPVTYSGIGHATTTVNSDGTTADTDVKVAVRENQRVTEVGTAILFDRRTGKTIWSATRNDYQWWVGVLAGGSNTGPAAVVDKLVKQLRKDHQNALIAR